MTKEAHRLDDIWTLTGENFSLLTAQEQARLLRDLAHYAQFQALRNPREAEHYAQLSHSAFTLASRLDPDGPVGYRESLPEDERQVASVAAGASQWAREQQHRPGPDLEDDDAPALRILESRAAGLAADLDPERQQALQREGR